MRCNSQNNVNNKQAIGRQHCSGLASKEVFCKVSTPLTDGVCMPGGEKWLRMKRLLLWGSELHVDETQHSLVGPVLWIFGFSKPHSFLDLDLLITSSLNWPFSNSSKQINQPLLREAAKLASESGRVLFPVERTCPLWNSMRNIKAENSRGS